MGKLLKELEELWLKVTEKSSRIVDAFMSSLLTLEQVRYASATSMGTRALRHFCNIDDPRLAQA
ncbi:MAG: hypothetical protein HQ488_04790 [Parcubacteria group bacterium]|nr:hypothetical protein [Parcubacteria group bacterium]